MNATMKTTARKSRCPNILFFARQIVRKSNDVKAMTPDQVKALVNAAYDSLIASMNASMNA